MDEEAMSKCKNGHEQPDDPPAVCPQCCGPCRGFGYFKGGPDGPWEKVDCKECGGSGKRREP